MLCIRLSSLACYDRDESFFIFERKIDHEEL